MRTGAYSQDARWRLAEAVKKAREAAGYKSRPAFYTAAGIGKRSLENVESLDPGAASVGETVLHAIGRALPNWTEDTPRIILEGGPIPENTPATSTPPRPQDSSDLAPLDEVLTATAKELATLARMYAWYRAQQEGRDPDPADEDYFFGWAVKVRGERRGIEPSGDGKRDVS